MSNLHQDTSMTNSPPVVTLSVPVYQPPTVIQSDLSMKHTSCGMITVGVFLILFSSGSLGLSAYLFGTIGSADIVWAAMISGSFFFLMGILAIYGGSSVWKRKGTIIISAIIGCIGIVAALVACGLAAYATNQENINRTLCITCHANLVANNIDFENKWKTLNIVKGELNGVCNFSCSLAPYMILGILAILEGFFGFILSIVACCNSCSCCCCFKGPPTNPTTVSSFPNFPAITNLGFNRPSGDYAYNRLEG